MPAMAALLEENQRLRAQWKSCEYRRQCAEQRAEELQSCVQQAEAAVRQKEAQWMAEFDRSVQALLQIIQHHEDEKTQLQKEVARLRAEAATATVAPAPITKMTRCTQTEKPRRNSVRFAKEEDEEVSEKERPAIDAEALHRLSRMQQLFEQLQLPRDQCSGKPVDRAEPATKREEIRLNSTGCDLKAAILERWGAASPVRSSVAAAPDERRSKTSDTQTEEPAPKLETPASALHQDLQERNRLLHERLASQQNVLDQLLSAKPKHVEVREQQQRKCDHLTPTPLAPGGLAQSADAHIESTQRRPLSPPAA